jgi:hypothetical protein
VVTELVGASVRFVGSNGDERLGVVVAVGADGLVLVNWERFTDLEARFVATKRKPSEHEQASIAAHTAWVYAPGHSAWPAGSRLEIE